MKTNTMLGGIAGLVVAVGSFTACSSKGMDVVDEVTDGSPKDGSPTDAGDAGDGDATPEPVGSFGTLAVGCFITDPDSGMTLCYGYDNPYPSAYATEFDTICTGAIEAGATGSLVTACPTSGLVGCCSNLVTLPDTTTVVQGLNCFYAGFTLEHAKALCAQLSDASTFQTTVP
jgi:hypothetical protein